MKKFYTLIFVFILFITSAQISYGIKGGYNISGMRFGDEQLKNKSYFYVGGYTERQISDKVSLQGEILFTEPGGKMNYELRRIVGTEIIVDGIETATFKFPQIQIPLLTKYYLADDFSLGLGFNFGINLNPTIKNYYSFPNPSEKSHSMENIKTLNIFPLANAEYKFNRNLFADIRYHFNFFNINKNGIDMKIALLQAGLGYRFK